MLTFLFNYEYYVSEKQVGTKLLFSHWGQLTIGEYCLLSTTYELRMYTVHGTVRIATTGHV